MTTFNWNYLFKCSIYKCSHIVSSWEFRSKTYEFYVGGAQFSEQHGQTKIICHQLLGLCLLVG